MSHRTKIIKEWVDVKVTSANQSFKARLEVDKHVKSIIGVLLTSDYEDKMYYRGSQRITINEKEITPEDYESKLLMHGLNVPTNERIVTFGEELEAGNREVVIEYKDRDHNYAPFTPYFVRLYVFSRIEH